MKVIIAGSRNFSDYQLLCRVMEDFSASSLFPITEVVSGTQRGADLLGEVWAKERGINIKPFPPDWDQYSFKAGPIRNAQMAKYADYLILFWDGTIKGNVGKGSRSMMNCMIKIKKPYKVINY